MVGINGFSSTMNGRMKSGAVYHGQAGLLMLRTNTAPAYGGQGGKLRIAQAAIRRKNKSSSSRCDPERGRARLAERASTSDTRSGVMRRRTV